MTRRPALAAAAVLLAASLTACERVSVSSTEDQADGPSWRSTLSRDGSLVAFDSNATNLAPGDGPARDVFLRDRATGETLLVSHGAETGGDSDIGTISANGRFVAFQSDSSTLVPGDTNGRRDAFVWERETGAITRVSVSSAGAEAAQGVSVSPVPPTLPISRNGRYVAFMTIANDLVPGDENGLADIFVRDRVAGTTARIAAESTGEPNVDADGSTLQGIGQPALSLDGRYVAFTSLRFINRPPFVKQTTDVYVHDRQTGATTRVSGAVRGLARYDVAIDSDGSHVAFASAASDLVDGDDNGLTDLFVRDMRTGVTVRVPAESTGEPTVRAVREPSLSRTGRFLTFVSDAESGGVLRAGANVYVHDFRTGQTRRLTNNPDADPAKLNHFPSLSADGRLVTWASPAPDLAPNDTNGVSDAFVAPVPR